MNVFLDGGQQMPKHGERNTVKNYERFNTFLFMYWDGIYHCELISIKDG
jgi:hypothetical protein